MYDGRSIGANRTIDNAFNFLANYFQSWQWEWLCNGGNKWNIPVVLYNRYVQEIESFPTINQQTGTRKVFQKTADLWKVLPLEHLKPGHSRANRSPNFYLNWWPYHWVLRILRKTDRSSFSMLWCESENSTFIFYRIGSNYSIFIINGPNRIFREVPGTLQQGGFLPIEEFFVAVWTVSIGLLIHWSIHLQWKYSDQRIWL